MLKKIPLLFFFILLSIILTAQQDSVRIEKAVLLFYDSTEIAPVVNLIPFGETGETAYLLHYRNIGSRDLFNLKEEYEVIHVSDPTGAPGFGLVYTSSLVRDTLRIREFRKQKVQHCTFYPTILGSFRMDFKIRNASNQLLDSSSFYFETSDTILSKSHGRVPTSKTGPHFFQDSNLSQTGGFAAGDRFGTLFEKNGSSWWLGDRPTSVSFYITADTSNVGVEIVPKIWQATLDSSQISLIVGNEVASAFIPTTIDSSMLGSELTLIFDNGTAVFSGLNEGKYIVGFESILQNPNGKSLKLGRDTVGEKLQPFNSSFVYFGHDTNWYAMNHLPMINLNFANGAGAGAIRPCNPVGLEAERDSHEELIIYPNPSNGTFTLENATSIQTLEIYNANGQKVQFELFNNQLDFTDQPKGIYLLRVLLDSGEVISKKLIKY